MFGFIKKLFFTAMTLLSFNVLSVNSLECISMKNQECKVRPKIINNDLFYPFSIRLNKCSGNCNSIHDPHFKECVPNIIKNMNLKVFDMVSWSNQIKQIKWHESCKCECKLNSSVCNNKENGVKIDVSVNVKKLKTVIKNL